MNVLSLSWFAKYGHFLRAEANTSALTYPIPPRTAILGLFAAILGLEKDNLAETLKNAQVALTLPKGLPQRFTHKVKLRKDPPTALPLTVKKTQKADKDSAPEKATLNLQEWLWQPHFHIHVALPEQVDLLNELVERIQNRRWHFCPCMGLSELLAEVEFLNYSTATRCDEELVEIQGVCPKNAIEKIIANREELGIQLLRLPYHVTHDRVFEHQSYYLEYRGRPFSVKTHQAWKLSEKLAGVKIVFY